MTAHEVNEGCFDCPHPDFCAGMGKCEIGAAKIAARSAAWTARFEAALERHLRQGCPHREAAVLAAQEARNA